jgi:hypothetical protein
VALPRILRPGCPWAGSAQPPVPRPHSRRKPAAAVGVLSPGAMGPSQARDGQMALPRPMDCSVLVRGHGGYARRAVIVRSAASLEANQRRRSLAVVVAGMVQNGPVLGNTLGWLSGGQFWPISSGPKSFRRQIARARVLPWFEPGLVAVVDGERYDAPAALPGEGRVKYPFREWASPQRNGETAFSSTARLHARRAKRG